MLFVRDQRLSRDPNSLPVDRVVAAAINANIFIARGACSIDGRLGRENVENSLDARLKFQAFESRVDAAATMRVDRLATTTRVARRDRAAQRPRRSPRDPSRAS